MGHLRMINKIRQLGVDQVEKANSGHPGIVMGAAPLIYSVFNDHINIDVKNPKWINRDRFVMSAGHGSALLYAMLHVTNHDLPIEDLKNFRQLGSKTPGHPEVGHTVGVEATSGPLGQGIAQSVGLAMAEKHLAAMYNKDNFNVIDHYTYAICGDGDLMEGVALEAISLAGHLKLDKLVVLYDSNDICLDGDLSTSFSENVIDKFKACNWNTILVQDADTDHKAIVNAIAQAKKSDKPTLIECKTTIGYGCDKKAGVNAAHGAPIGSEEYAFAKAKLNWDEPFEVDENVYAHFAATTNARGTHAFHEWEKMMEKYKSAHNGLYTQLMDSFKGDYYHFYKELPKFNVGDKVSTRIASGKIMNEIVKTIPNFFGGSADLAHSNMTYLNGAGDFHIDPAGKNIWYGVREFAMASASNGIMLHGGLETFVSTFFVFTDYLKPALRMSAIQNIAPTFVMTHDSVAVGEDGPTHEPIEQLAMVRSIPNVNLIRPADANETVAAWRIAIEAKTTPTVLSLTRQDILINAAIDCYEDVKKGAYIISANENATMQLVATGSEVALAIETQELLKTKGIEIEVVSMPSMHMFEAQDASYKASVLKDMPRIAVEMGTSFGWHKYVTETYCIDTFGASGPGNLVMEHFGFTAEKLANYIENL